MALRARVTGLVQGVSFRDFVRGHATRLGLVGYVRNLPDGTTVEVYAEGQEAHLRGLIDLLWRGPDRARVTDVAVEWLAPQGQHRTFQIAR
ncbi:MAG: acylphosphatase [Chloroflexi bacterium]|nr:acylphosphatase [Chloroflexota bacterium]